MKQTHIRFNLDGLEHIRRQVGDSYKARVGILGSQAAQSHVLEKRGFKENRASDNASGLTNAEIGVIQMFGSVTNGIPPRDFLRMPLEKNRRELVLSLGKGAMRAAFARGEYKLMFALLGAKAEEFVQEAFETGGFGMWPPNRPSTIARKGSSRPLIGTAQLRRSITSDVVGKGEL